MFQGREFKAGESRRTPVDVQRLIADQSPGAALVAAFGMALCLNAIWLWLSDTTGSFFHWYSVLQGPLIGLAVRKAGHGLDWRFPALAVAVTMIAAFSGNFLVSLVTTSAALEASPWQVLRGLTVWSWQIWYNEVLVPADLVYAMFASAVAAFYSKRQLRRQEMFALRGMNEESRK